MAEDSGDKTEAATPRRLARAREEGGAPVSRDVSSLAGLAAAAGVIAMAAPTAASAIAGRLAALLALPEPPVTALLHALQLAGMIAAPLVLAAASGAVAGALLQTGGSLTPGLAMPDLSRLSPARGWSRLVSARAGVEAAKSVLKLGVLGLLAWHTLEGELPLLRRAMLWLPGLLARNMFAVSVRLLMTLLAAQLVIAGADMAWQRFKQAQELRMTKQEVKEEAKESDGNPLIKQRIRRLRMARARRRMMAAVPKATVVVTNPTHYAVALAYERGRPAAPRVVAKGIDDMAARIRSVAREHSVPLVANPPLARALYQVELDEEIPPEHFRLVAEIIAYVWRLRPAPPPPS